LISSATTFGLGQFNISAIICLASFDFSLLLFQLSVVVEGHEFFCASCVNSVVEGHEFICLLHCISSLAHSDQFFAASICCLLNSFILASKSSFHVHASAFDLAFSATFFLKALSLSF